MKKPENLEFKLLMKNIKRNRNIIENRNKTRQEFKQKRDEYNKKLDEIRLKNVLNFKNKKIEFYKRQMSRDLKDLQKRYQILKPGLDEAELQNKNAGIKIDTFSHIHRQQVKKMKNNFYKKNENLKFEQNNYIENFQYNTDKINLNNNIKNTTRRNNTYNKNKFNAANNNKFQENKRNNNKYQFYKDDKLDENKINNVCFDGNFFDNKFKK